MTQVFRTVLATAVLTGFAVGQQKDTVVLTDGTTFKNVKITKYDVETIEWRKSNSVETRASDKVAEVTCDRVTEIYRRAYSLGNSPEAAGTFIDEAAKQEDPFLKQFGYYEAAQLRMIEGNVAQAFAVFAELRKQVPTSAFTIEEYRTKFDYYTGLGKDGAVNSKKVATAYRNEAATKLSRGFQVEAQLYLVIADLLGGQADANQIKDDIDRVVSDASGFPNVRQRAMLVKADLLRSSSDLSGASELYEELLEEKYSTNLVRGGALLGRGHVQLKRGTPGDKEPFREALLAFLRVYVEREGLAPSTVAEALFFGKQAANSWGGEDSNRMAGYLQFRLERDYPETTWAKR